WPQIGSVHDTRPRLYHELLPPTRKLCLFATERGFTPGRPDAVWPQSLSILLRFTAICTLGTIAHSGPFRPSCRFHPGGRTPSANHRGESASCRDRDVTIVLLGVGRVTLTDDEEVATRAPLQHIDGVIDHGEVGRVLRVLADGPVAQERLPGV